MRKYSAVISINTVLELHKYTPQINTKVLNKCIYDVAVGA